MAHSKNDQAQRASHDSGTSLFYEKDQPMACYDQVSQESTIAVQQLCEITGVTFEEAYNAFIAANSSVENALAFLTNPQQHKEGTSKKAVQTSVVKNSPTKKDDIIDLTKDKDERDEDLEKAIALSLQESNPSAAQGITAEEQDISRVLEASLIENKSGLKRKRGDPWMTFVDPVNPYERKRTEGTPVGFKNVGNTCWFSAVIQSLFHLPVFRKLVLNCIFPELTQKESKDIHRLSFMQELRNLFALLIGSKRKYVDPTKAVEILKEALQYNGSESNPGNQQDVSEFTHKLLEWLEDTFTVESCAASSKKDNSGSNPVMELFFGQSKVEGVYEGKTFSNLEMFGAYPLQVQGYSNLHDSLEGGMARGEIEPASNVQTHKSDQEHWFTRLPAVLKFMLSRFLFNQSTGRAEKIHERFAFERIIFMDRYMENNKDITRIRREEVKKLKERYQLLRASLDSFTNYGTGTRRSHIQDILDSSFQFVQSTPPSRDNECCDIEMETLIPGSPRCSTSGLTTIRPAPRHVTEGEVETIENCFRRWRTEVEQDVKDISKNLKEVEEAISIMYDDQDMKKVPYRLHAVLVHEGQASGGHYWAYIYNPIDNRWRKYNDITVSEVTWEEVERESLGGYRHVSAYGLMYVDARREELVRGSDSSDTLPEDLQRLVDEDNLNFEKEIVEWDEKQAATAKASPEDKHKALVAVRPDLVLDAEASCAVSPNEQSSTVTITEASSPQDLDNVLSKWCINEKTRLEKISREHPPDSPRDVRLEYLGIYLIRCQAPDHVVEWVILSQVIDDIQAKDTRFLPLLKRAQAHLITLKSDELDNWKDKYSVFQKVNSCFLTGLEHLHNQKYQDALPYLVHAYTLNHTLEDTGNPSQSMDEHLLAYCRRVCFLKLNELAVALFEAQDHSTLCKGLDLVSELVVPCIPTLISSPHAEDREAVEHMRHRWFTYLGGGMLDDKRQEKLQDFLPKLLDVSLEAQQEIRPPPVLRPTSARDLCERFTRAMELVHANMAFSAKA